MSPFEFNFFFSLTGFLSTLVYNCICTTDYEQLLELSSDQHFQVMFFIFAVLGAIFSFSIAITVAVAGPLALNVTGIIKDVFLTYAGFMFFNETKVTRFVVVGLAFSFVGAVWTILHKYKVSNQTTKTHELVEDDEALKKKTA